MECSYRIIHNAQYSFLVRLIEKLKDFIDETLICIVMHPLCVERILPKNSSCDNINLIIGVS